MYLLFYISAYLLWIGSEIYLNRFARSGNIQKERKDQGSEWILWITAFIAVTLASLIAIYSDYSIFLDFRWAQLGLWLMIFGVVFRFIAIQQLGKFFTVDVILHADHQLIQTGLYKKLRHPSYTGIMITLAGFGLSLNNYLSLVLVVSLFFVALQNRINIEEKALLQKFGMMYEQYSKTTWKLIPFVF
jgi:protein-S-isoprenylcysteine O-methyltransferase Ste14